MFTISRYDINNRTAIEQLGTKPKHWFQKVLFKVEDRETGEDWAEKISCQLCEHLGLPHVHYELADLYDGNTWLKHGVICETCSPSPSSLVLGNELLFQLDPTYPSKEDRRYKVREHTVDAVCEVLGRLALPNDCWMVNTPSGLETALDIFIGYVMLDTWIANQDRHHENWGALQEDKLRLAPTFDHGAALARNISNEERYERMNTKDCNYSLERFVKKAKSAFYKQPTDTKVLGTFEAFGEFARHSLIAAQMWINRLGSIKRDAIEAIVNEVPDHRMPGIAKKFTIELLVVNQSRLLQEYFK
jgi:hypothetical protein